MTLEQLQSQFQVSVPDFPYSSYTSTVLEWFNLAQDAIAEKELIDIIATSQSTEDQTYVNYPSDYIKAKRDGLYYDDDLVEIISVSEAIDQYGTDWRTEDSGTPLFAVDSGSELILVPPADTAGKEIRLYYFGRANDLSSSSDVPFTTGESGSYNYHNNLRSLDSLVLDYAIAMAENSLGKYKTRAEALTSFYAQLEVKAKNLKNNPNFERQQFGLDKMYAQRLKNRHGIS